MTAKERHRAEVFSRDDHVCALAELHPWECDRLTADHCIEVAWLKELHKRRLFRDGFGLAIDFDEVVADGRNGWILCERVHSVKTCGLIVIDRSLLPPSVFDFNDDYDCAHLMESRACFA